MNSPIPGTKIQGLMFPKALYTPARAASWAMRNGFDGSAPDAGSATATMIRVRAKGATRFVKGSFKTVPISDGVKAVIGVPVPVVRKNPAKRRRINGDVLPFRRRGAPVPMKHYVGDSDEDVSDAPTVERAIVRQAKAGRTAKPKAPKVSDSFPIDEVIAMDKAYGRGVSPRSRWYPLDATYGQYIVNIEESGGKYRVAFAAVGTDTGNPPRFEAALAWGHSSNTFKTKAGAARAALKWLANNDRAVRANPRQKLRRNTSQSHQEATMAGRPKSRARRNPGHIGWQEPTASQKKWGVDLVGYTNDNYCYEIESETVRGAEYHEVYIRPPVGSFGGGVREKVSTRGTLALAKALAESNYERMVGSRANPHKASAKKRKNPASFKKGDPVQDYDGRYRGVYIRIHPTSADSIRHYGKQVLVWYGAGPIPEWAEEDAPGVARFSLHDLSPAAKKNPLTVNPRKSHGVLCDYQTGATIRKASAKEASASKAAARRDGGAGVILCGGRTCYVEG